MFECLQVEYKYLNCCCVSIISYDVLIWLWILFILLLLMEFLLYDAQLDVWMLTTQCNIIHVTKVCSEHLGYVCNLCSLKEGTETSCRMTDEIGISLERDISTSSVTKWANGYLHAIIASICRWSQREYKRQQVHCINHAFAEEPSRWPGHSAVVQQLRRRDVSIPSFRERGLHT